MNQDNGGIIGKLNTPTTSVASGVWTLQDQFEAQTSSIWPLAFPQTTFTNSCRFNSGDTDYLSKTFSGDSSRRTFTYSCWVKKVTTASGGALFGVSGDSGGYIWFLLSGTVLYLQNNPSSTVEFQTTQRTRDLSAFMHILLAIDTTQSTSTDRVKLYINGEQVTSFSTSTYPSLNQDLQLVTGTNPLQIGEFGNEKLDAYLSEVIWVDGQQLTPTSFGATNPATNIWEPITYTGTYGTNGFKLNFSDSSNLGDDTSGNGHDFTVNNLTSIDQATDTPSNNFATLNPLASGVAIGGSAGTFTDGNLFFSGASSAWCATKGTFSVTQGKWYMEAKKTTNANGTTEGAGAVAFGFAELQSSLGNHNPLDSNVYNSILVINDNGWTTNFASGSQWSTPLAVDDGNIVGIALDLDGNNYTFYVNGSQVDTGSLGAGYDGNGLTPCVINYGGDTREFTCNFGSPPFAISSGNADANGHGNFEYAVPSGYYALNTKNLAEFG